MKGQGYDKPWDTSTYLMTYFTYLDEFQENLEVGHISTLDNKKVLIAVSRMWESEFFTHDNMQQWKDQDMGD